MVFKKICNELNQFFFFFIVIGQSKSPGSFKLAQQVVISRCEQAPGSVFHP
jgi:hypothetical protein